MSNPLLLHVETATTNCSVALSSGSELQAELEVDEGYKHAEQLASLTEQVLKEAAISIADLSGFVLGIGPGSYTGLRIGAGFIKGLAFASGKPIVGIGTLQSLYRDVQPEPNDIVIPMLDARRMEVYSAVYKDGSCIRDVQAEVLDESSYADYRSMDQVLMVGPGAEKCKALFPNQENVKIYTDSKPRGRNMIQDGLDKFKAGDFLDTAYFEPFYLKDFVAGKPKKLL